VKLHTVYFFGSQINKPRWLNLLIITKQALNSITTQDKLDTSARFKIRLHSSPFCYFNLIVQHKETLI